MAERLTALTPADQTRVEAVLTEHGRFIEAVATQCAPSRALVPDIVQEVSMRLCQSLPTFREDSHIRTWLFAVTRNAAVSMYRRTIRMEHGQERLAACTVDDVVDVEADVIEADDQAYRKRLMHRAMGTLTPRQQEAVRNMLAPRGVSLNRDKTTLFRARARMRRWIADQQQDLDE